MSAMAPVSLVTRMTCKKRGKFRCQNRPYNHLYHHAKYDNAMSGKASDHLIRKPAGVAFNVTHVRAETRLLEKVHCKVCQAKAVETLVTESPCNTIVTLVVESSCNTIVTLVVESSCNTIITLVIESSCNTIIVRKQYIEARAAETLCHSYKY